MFIRTFPIALLLLISNVFAQPSHDGFNIRGRVLDAGTKRPMEYVNIVLYASDDSALVAGTVTDERGFFTLKGIRIGGYYMDVRFMGYETKRVNNVTVRNKDVDLGDIILVPTTINLGEVVVEGERSAMTYQIDKKVINVDELTTRIGGTAADVLATVPSVRVDIEGNVTLRGSGSFTVLIDGRPSVLDAQDALQQLPASTIESIEIITNPSAKYNPEGTAGIININMRKQQRFGWSGIINANAGLNEKYGGDLLAEHRNGSIATIFGIDYNNRLLFGDSESEERYEFQGNTTRIQTNGDLTMLRNSFGLRAGVEFAVSEQGVMSLNGRYGTREWQRNAAVAHNLFSGNSSDPVRNNNALHRMRSGNFSSFNLGYRHSFGSDDHKLLADLGFRYRDSDELTTSELFAEQRLASGTKSTESGPSRDWNIRLEYSLPLGGESKFEAGYQGEIDLDEEGTTISVIDSLSGSFVLQPQYSNHTRYNEKEHAVYSLYAGELEAIGYQAGLRAEYTNRLISLVRGDAYLTDRWDFFPTFHVSYKFGGGHQMMASYTRRIERPRGWELEPFETWIDANNVRKGNPALAPEFIDSYELAAQTLIGTTSLSVEVYHRIGTDKIEDIRSVYADNVTMTTFGNVGREYSSGLEFLANFDLVEGWNMNLIGDVYDYRFEGTLFDEPFSKKSFNGSVRFNNLVKFGSSTQFQVNANWESPAVTPQGREESSYSVDLAAKQELMNKQLSLTLQIQNLLRSARNQHSYQGSGFSSFSKHVMESPVVMLTARFSINKQNTERERERQERFDGEEF